VSGVTLDAGALIAFERGRRDVDLILDRAVGTDVRISIPAGALAQVWRDGGRQARLARLLEGDHVDVVALDDRAARAIGQICRATGATDVIDVSVVLCARLRRQAVVTSDPGDLLRIDPGIRVVAV
jgi:hypothetical protein